MKIKILLVLAFIAADIVTGVSKAIATGTKSSAVMRAGLSHKIFELYGVGFGILCDLALPYIDVALPVSLFACAVYYVIGMEALSILENIKAIAPGLGGELEKHLGNLAPQDAEEDEHGAHEKK